MLEPRHALVVVFGLALGVAACGPTVEEAAKEFLPPFCEKFRTCNQAAFDRAYPTIDACVQKGISGIASDDLKKRSACNDEELDVCKSDIQKLDCSNPMFQTGDTSQLPASCKGC